MTSTNLFYLRINSALPPATAIPQHRSVSRPAPTGISMNRRPVGASGYWTVVLWWDDVPYEGLRWWLDLFAAHEESIDLTDFAINTVYGAFLEPQVTEDGGHLPAIRVSEWTSGVLHRPTWDEATEDQLSLMDGTWTPETVGRVEIRVTALGAPL